MRKIVLAQINTLAGDIKGNAAKIKEYISRAKQDNAGLIVFPELSLIGYPFGDIFIRHKSLIDRQLEELNDIKKETTGITALIGFAEPNKNEGQKPFFNSVAVIQDGKIINTVRKRLLPNYSEFNDYRYFEPSHEEQKVFEIDGEVYGIIVCEDSFNDKSFFQQNSIYEIDPIEQLMKQKPQTIINCSCSPSRNGKEFIKNTLFSSIAKKYGVNYIYVNQSGYADNLCFDGTSRIYNKDGILTARAKSFEEEYFLTENYKAEINPIPLGMDKKVDINGFSMDYQNDLERTYKTIVFAIKEYFSKNGFSKAVLGLSGGLDSSVCAVLLADALGKENVWGISMPSKITSGESKNDAKVLAENLGINFFEVPLADTIEKMKSMLNFSFDNIKTDKYDKPTTIENLQARLRATILWSISNEYKYMLPIATSDKSEAYIGYATVNGDMSGGFAPIADVTKTKLFALADYMNKNRENKNVIPQSVLIKPPGAELKINPETGKTVCAEEDNMPYEFLDEIIWFVENSGYGFNDLMYHTFLYEKKHSLTTEQKKEWINKFFRKSKCAVYKWHILPPSVITDIHSINSVEYHQPIISRVFQSTVI
ncbi:MAG: NAD(+) synthase [Candidatus Avigastranaerophilus sp.]